MTTSAKASYIAHYSFRVICLISLILLSSLFALSSPETHAAPIRTYEQQLEQVRLYINNDMFEAAKRELERLQKLERGKSDERVHIALAKVNYKLFNITQALSNLRRARNLVRDTNARQKLTVLYEQWLSIYGLVRFESVDQLQTGTIELVRKRKFINRDRQLALEKVQESLQDKVQLPASIYLPYGSYLANGVSFRVKRNQPTPIVELMLTPIVNQTPVPVKRDFTKWVYVGLGSLAFLSATIGGYYLLQEPPPPSRQLTITLSDGK